MSSQTRFLARLIGLFLVAMSLALVVNQTAMTDTVTAIVHAPGLLLAFGMIALVVGLAVVLSHNLWSGGAAVILVTLFGWLMLVRGVGLLLLPSAVIVSLFERVHFGEFAYLYAAVVFVVGLFLAWSGFRSPPAARA